MNKEYKINFPDDSLTVINKKYNLNLEYLENVSINIKDNSKKSISNITSSIFNYMNYLGQNNL